MELIVSPNGRVRCVYDEVIDLSALGRLSITRASHVEPSTTGDWCADLTPVQGPILGPFSMRTQALAAERAWLDSHWLVSNTDD